MTISRRWTPLVLALLIGCGGGAPAKKRLVVYSPHGKELLDAYEQAFEAAHPDVDVQSLDMGSQTVYDRVRTEGANPQASLWWGAPSTLFAEAAKESLLTAYTPTWAAAVPTDGRDPAGFWFGTYQTPEVIAYNTRTVDSAAVPRTWDGLLDPVWKGQILIRSPLESGTMRTLFSAFVDRAIRAGGTEADGFAWLKRLDANTKTYASDPTQLYLKLAREEGKLTIWNLPDIVLQAQDHGYPFGYVIPSDGTPVVTDAIALVRGGPEPELARQFYEFVTTTSALVDQAVRFHRIPVRTDIPKADLPVWMQVEIPAMPVDWARLGASERSWMTRWDAEVRGQGSH